MGTTDKLRIITSIAQQSEIKEAGLQTPRVSTLAKRFNPTYIGFTQNQIPDLAIEPTYSEPC